MEHYKTIHENKVMINPPKVKLKLTIKTKSWNHTCGDGCCYSHGTDIYINNKKVSQGDYDDIDTILKEVLENLGYEIEVDYEAE